MILCGIKLNKRCLFNALSKTTISIVKCLLNNGVEIDERITNERLNGTKLDKKYRLVINEYKNNIINNDVRCD